MKKILIIFILGVAIFLGSFANGNKEAGGRKTIKVGTEGTYKPYSYHDETGALTGYDVDVITLVAERIGYKVEFVESRWDGLLAGLKTNRWDVVANQVWWNESRANDYLLSNAYLIAGASVLTRADNSASSSSDLKDQKAAVSLTSSFRPYVEKITQDLKFQDDFNLAVDLLLTKRVDFIVNDTQSIGVYVKENPNANLKILALDGAKTTDVVFAINKQNTKLLEQINEALGAISSDGTLDELREKYFAK